MTFKDFLESTARPIAAGWFDLSSDPNALSYLYNIKLNTQAPPIYKFYNSVYWHESGNKETHVWGLDRCTDYSVSGSLSSHHHTDFYITSYGKRLLADKKLERFYERPLPIELLKYCTGDVALLPDMFDAMIKSFQTLTDPELAVENAREVSTWRGLHAMSDDFTQERRHDCLAPWGGISSRGSANFEAKVQGAYTWRQREWKVAERDAWKREQFIAVWEHRFEKCFETDGQLLQPRKVGDDGLVWRSEGYTDAEYEIRFYTHRQGYADIEGRYREREFWPYWVDQHCRCLKEIKIEIAANEIMDRLGKLSVSRYYDELLQLEEDVTQRRTTFTRRSTMTSTMRRTVHGLMESMMRTSESHLILTAATLLITTASRLHHRHPLAPHSRVSLC